MIRDDFKLKNLEGSFGVMQGRLTKISKHGYQVFPHSDWTQEFYVAALAKFDHIEWVVDSRYFKKNPVLVNPELVNEVTLDSGVKIVSACLDYLMDDPLNSFNSEIEKQFETLEKVFCGLSEVGCEWAVIPYVDQSSLVGNTSLSKSLTVLGNRISELCEKYQLKIALETDLDPEGYGNLLGTLPSGWFYVNYDIGNSASLGFKWSDEFSSYGDRLGLIHVKDRVLGGGSVFLGTGDADIPAVFSDLVLSEFRGPITMQAYRDKLGLPETLKQRDWVQSNAFSSIQEKLGNE